MCVLYIFMIIIIIGSFGVGIVHKPHATNVYKNNNNL